MFPLTIYAAKKIFAITVFNRPSSLIITYLHSLITAELSKLPTFYLSTPSCYPIIPFIIIIIRSKSAYPFLMAFLTTVTTA